MDNECNKGLICDAQGLIKSCTRAGERELISVANMHVPGRQPDPAQVRRDLARLRSWRAGWVEAAA